MKEEQVTVITVVGGGISGTAQIDATGEVADFVNPGNLPVVPNVTKNLAYVQRLPVGLPPISKAVIILK